MFATLLRGSAQSLEVEVEVMSYAIALSLVRVMYAILLNREPGASNRT
jgi:hypothetical protein